MREREDTESAMDGARFPRWLEKLFPKKKETAFTHTYSTDWTVLMVVQIEEEPGWPPSYTQN